MEVKKKKGGGNIGWEGRAVVGGDNKGLWEINRIKVHCLHMKMTQGTPFFCTITIC